MHKRIEFIHNAFNTTIDVMLVVYGCILSLPLASIAIDRYLMSIIPHSIYIASRGSERSEFHIYK